MTRHKREQVSRRDLNSFRSCENVCLISRRREIGMRSEGERDCLDDDQRETR